MASQVKAGDAYVSLGVKMNARNIAQMKKALKLEQLGGELMSIGSSGALAFAAIGGAAMFAAKRAGDLEAELIKTERIFPTMNKSLVAWGNQYGRVFGRSRMQTTEMLNVFGSVTKGMGVSEEATGEFARAMAVATSNFSTFNKMPMEEAILRIKSALTGSGEVLDMFGIDVKQTNLDLKLLDMGFKTTSQGATEQQKVLARATIIMESLHNLNADVADQEMYHLPRAMEMFKAAAADLTGTIGKNLTPVLQFFLETGRGMMMFFDRNSKLTSILVLVLGGLTLAVTSVTAAIWLAGFALKTYSMALVVKTKLTHLASVANNQYAASFLALAANIRLASLAMHGFAVAAGVAIAVGATKGMAALGEATNPARGEKWKALRSNPQATMGERAMATGASALDAYSRFDAWLTDTLQNAVWNFKENALGFDMTEERKARRKLREEEARDRLSLAESLWGSPARERQNAQQDLMNSELKKFKDEVSGPDSPSSANLRTKLPEAMEYGTRKAMETFFGQSMQSAEQAILTEAQTTNDWLRQLNEKWDAQYGIKGNTTPAAQGI